MIAIRCVYRYRYQVVSRRQWIGTVVSVPAPTGVPNQLMMVGVGI